MLFRISIHDTREGGLRRSGPVTTENTNWFSALVEGLSALEQPLSMKDLSFSLLDDGQSAIISDTESGLLFEVTALEKRHGAAHDQRESQRPSPIPKTLCCSPSTPPPAPLSGPTLATPPLPIDPDATAEMSPIPEEADFVATMAEPGLAAPQEKPDTFTQRGAYRPGQTDAFLTHAFMNLSDLQARFSDDHVGAADHMLRFVAELSDAAGGGVLFFDINEPAPTLEVVAAHGAAREQLLRCRVALGQGPVGVCANLGVSLKITNLAHEVQLEGGILTQLGLEVGPILCVPIQGKDWLQGVVMIYKAPGRSPFTDSELGIIEHIATTFGTYLRSSQATWRDKGDSKQTRVERPRGRE